VLISVSDDGAIARGRFTVATSIVSDVSCELTGVTHEGQVRQKILDAVADLSGYVRVTLHGALGPDVDLRLQDFEQLRPPNLDALVVQFGSVSVALSDDYGLLANEQTVRGQFVRDVLAADSLTDDQRHQVLVTGLRALNERVRRVGGALMRIRSVTAHAFGPLRNKTLTFADGMTVVVGDNESAKSSWQRGHLRRAVR